jgi:deoxyribodipyrimidine photo-lyase
MDSRDLPFPSIADLSDVYTTFRKALEPLRERPRSPLPIPTNLPPLVKKSLIPPQPAPFIIPDSLVGILEALMKPLHSLSDLKEPPSWPDDSASGAVQTQSAHPFQGGETVALARVDYLLSSGAMTAYKDTRNGLVGPDFSTKLSGYLAIGCITARQVHAEMLLFENGDSGPEGSSTPSKEWKEKVERWKAADGFGQGENKGTAGVRFELLWRDYFRLVARKYGAKLFLLQGLRGSPDKKWRHVRRKDDSHDEADTTEETLQRFCSGRTGIALIDASQREIYLTGYTSNRARQNVASFLAKHLNVDWRLGAEWYESMLVDYDVANNWGNWQYVAGVGNDPREGRLFNPVKQALDYDKKGEYIKTWVPELRGLELGSEKNANEVDDEKLMGLFQPWRLSEAEQQKLGLKGINFVEDPLVRIPFSIGKKPRAGGGRGRGNGYRGRGAGRGGPSGRGRGRWRPGGDRGSNGTQEAGQSRQVQ